MADVDIRATFIDSQAQQEIQRLKESLRGLEAQENRIRGSAFDAYSRAQMQPRIDAINELRGALNKTAAELEVVDATISGGSGNLASFINSVVGADRAIKSAQSSARVLGSSISSLAADDSRARDAKLGLAAATEKVVVATTAEAAAQRAARDALDAKLFGTVATAPASSSRSMRPQIAEVDELARKLAGLELYAAAGASKISSAFAGAQPGLASFEQQIVSIKARLEQLITAGATGGVSGEFAAFLKSSASADKEQLLKNLVSDAALYVAQQRAVAVAVSQSNAAENQRLQTLRLIKQAVVPASGAGTAQIIAETIRHGQVSAFTAEQIKEMSQAWPAVGRAARAAHSAVEGAASGIGQSLRHVIALGDEAARGQRGAMAASAMALFRDSGALAATINALSGSWGVFAAAGVGALVAVGYAAEQVYQKTRSIEDAAGQLALRGFGDQTGNLTAQFSRLQEPTNEYAGVVRQLQGELSRLPPAALAVGEALKEDATAAAGFLKEDPAKVLNELTKAALKSPQALAEVREAMFGLTGVTNDAGQSIQQAVATTAGLSAQYRVAASFGRELTKATVEGGTAARKAQAEWWQNLLALAGLGFAAGGAQPLVDKLGESLDRAVNPAKGVAASAVLMSDSLKDLNGIVESANASLEARLGLLNRLQAVQTGLSGSIGEYGAGQGNEEARATAAGNLAAQARGARMSPEEEESRRRDLETNRARAEARSRDLRAQRDAAAERVRIEEDAARKRLPGGDVGQDIQVQSARNALLEADRRIEDERNQIAIAGNNARKANEAIGTQERIKAQEANIAILQKERDAGRATDLQVAQAAIELGTLKRQLANKTFQEARDNARAEVELAKGNVAQIIAAYERLATAARATGQAPAVNAQIQREKVRDLESAQSQAFTKIMEFNSSVERQDAMRINAYRAQLQVQVAQHGLSKDQMEAKEAQFTSQLFAQEESRVERQIANDNLTEAQKIRLYDKLSELYAKDAEKQEQAQAKLTQAIEAENTKRLKSITNMFDSIGTGLEKLAEAAIMRTQTRAEALRSFAQTVGKSLITELGHVGSQYAGKGLAGLLGVKTEGMADTGIGAILGKALGDKLGLTKESTGAEALKGVADKWQKAADAQQKAVDLQAQAGKELKEAADALKGVAGARGVPGGYGKTGGTADIPLNDNEAPSSAASAAVDFALERSGEKLKNYCAILVNQSLEKAGVKGSGSGLASSFGPNSNFGTSVGAGDVRKGDVFYSPPSGWGDTGHVGFATGPVVGGRVPVMSSHMQGDPSNPAGEETRSTAGLTFRRPDYPTGTISREVAQGVQQGNTELIDQNDQVVMSSMDLSTQISGDKTATDQQKQATTQNTTALQQQKSGTGIGGTSGTTSTTSSLGLLTQGLGIAASAAAIFGRQLSPTMRAVLGTIGVLTQLSTFVRGAGATLGLFDTATKATSVTTTLLGTATTANSLATTINTTATTANSTAQTAAAAGSGIGGILKGIPLLGMLFEKGGIVPSAAGGMISGGGLSILHPREMVLPAHLSVGLQNMIDRGHANNNQAGPTLNYNANVTGYHPYASKAAFDALLRQHGNALMGHVENAVRNGWRAA